MTHHAKEKVEFYEALFEALEGVGSSASWWSPSEVYANWRTKSILLRHFAEEIKDGMTVLDIGCAVGTDIFSLNLHCLLSGIKDVRFTGVDISSKAVAQARKIAKHRGYDNCRFEVADAERLKLGRKFDIIACSQNLEHMDDMVNALKLAKNHLKPGGVYLANLPFTDRIKLWAPKGVMKSVSKSNDWGWYRAGKKMEKVLAKEREFEGHGGGHLAHRSLLKFGEVKKNFEQAGFKVEKVERDSPIQGNRWFDDHPMIFSAIIVLDKIVPFKRFGSNIVIKARA